MSRFPDLPILPSTPPPPPAPRRSTAERYGAILYLGLGGLAVLVGLVAWFAWSAWGLRDVWEAIYVMNDPARPEAERVAAAGRLAADPRVTPRQLWDLALSRVPPERARYIVAEALDGRAIAADPSGFALAVARSEGWPGWLRVLLARPLAYGADEHALPKAPLAELRAYPDAIVALWAAYAQAAGRDDAEARQALETAREGENAGLARLLAEALDAPTHSETRRARLDAATDWLRDNHPDARRVWGAAP
jgi:hypothetical protein